MLRKLKQGLSNKYSFVPKVTSRTDSYNPNLESIHNSDEAGVIKGSFNPDYAVEEIKDNYFTQRDDQDMAAPRKGSSGIQSKDSDPDYSAKREHLAEPPVIEEEPEEAERTMQSMHRASINTDHSYN